MNTSLLIIIHLIAFVACEILPRQSADVDDNDAAGLSRDKKVLSLFSVITFPNDVCVGNSKNGTCYTADECTSIGGKNDGTCASGYGVCCTLTISCGGSSSQNCTYIEQTATTSLTTNPCTYTISKSSSSICRIRYDFDTFAIDGPETGIVADAQTSTEFSGESIGDCLSDKFTLTSPGRTAPPVICGYNTGQHMYVDASDQGHIASFSLSSAASSRSWSVKVTQYDCNSALAGPPGCLQYFTESSGTFASYNFPTASTTISSTATHLSNQDYSMCFRRESGYCAICFTPKLSTEMAAIAQGSFGLSNTDDEAKSGVDSACTSDYIGIYNGIDAANAAISTVSTTVVQKICGRVWGTSGDVTPANAASVCTRNTPFKLVFHSDDDEDRSTPAKGGTDELSKAPGGTVGFWMSYKQLPC